MWPVPESLSFSLLPLEFSDSLSTPSLICDQGHAPGLQGPTWIPDRAQPKLTEGWPGLDAAPDGPPSKPQNDHHPFPSIPNHVPSSAHFSAGKSHICFCHLLAGHLTVFSACRLGPVQPIWNKTTQIYILKLHFEVTHLLTNHL